MCLTGAERRFKGGGRVKRRRCECRLQGIAPQVFRRVQEWNVRAHGRD